MMKLFGWLKTAVGIAVAVIGSVIAGTAATVLIYTQITKSIDDLSKSLDTKTTSIERALENEISDLEDDISDLKAKDQLDAKQWIIIREHETRLSKVEEKTKPISQESWEKWGEVQALVRRHDSFIEQHRREHQQMWFDDRTR
jgi:Skp family chaperone for outer membrane proteins